MPNDALHLLTSLPSVMRRQDCNGDEIGDEYLARCIASWRQSGFAPVTINSEREPAGSWATADGIRRIQVQNDAKVLCGKPLVYVADMLECAASLTTGPVAITNSDILLSIPDQLQQNFRDLKPGEFYAIKRHDVRDLTLANPTEYKAGYDLFVFHTDDIRGRINRDFVFGLPWWDYFLPCMLLMSGVRARAIAEPVAYHLLHEGRWDKDIWLIVGQAFYSEINQAIRRQNHGGTRIAELRSALVSAIPERFSEPGLFQKIVKRWKPQPAPDMTRPELLRLSNLTRKWIESGKAAESVLSTGSRVAGHEVARPAE